MSFMHIETMIAASAVPSLSLTGSLESPNVVVGTAGTDDGNVVTVAQARWGVSAVPNPPRGQGNMMRGSTNAVGVPNPPVNYSSFLQSTQWINDKDFTDTYWVRARWDPLASGDPLWGTPPTFQSAIDSWYALIPTKSNREWGWACTSGYNCTAEGTIFLEIARNGASTEFNSANIDAGTDIITTDAPHGYTTGDSVIYSKEGGSANTFLLEASAFGITYFVRSWGASTLALHSTRLGAQLNGVRVQANPDGAETHTFTTTGDVLVEGYYKGTAMVLT